MSINKLLDLLKEEREGIILTELSALFHDLDKSKKDFIYSSDFHSFKKEIFKDFDKKKTKEEQIELRDKFIKEKIKRFNFFLGEDINKDKEIIFKTLNLENMTFIDGNKNILRKDCFGRLSSAFVEHHDNSGFENGYSLVGIVVHAGGSGADGIDSALDKNADIEQENIFKIDNPFGTSSIDWEDISDSLKRLLSQKSIDLDNKNLKSLKKSLQEIMRKSLGETRYPCNDVTLWDHSYSVSCLAKAIIVKIILEYNHGNFTNENPYFIPSRPDPKDKDKNKNNTDFSLFRISFDIDYLLMASQKPGDIEGTLSLIETIQETLRDYIELELLVGNEIYKDLSTQLFIIPKLADFNTILQNSSKLHDLFKEEIHNQITEKIKEIYKKEKLIELPVCVDFPDDSGYEELAIEKKFLSKIERFLSKKREFIQFTDLISKSLEIKGNFEGVCQLCKIRLVEFKNREEHICSVCLDRRRKGERERFIDIKKVQSEKSTINLDELLKDKKEENKLVLISVFFDIQKLLNSIPLRHVCWKDKENKKNKKNMSLGRLMRCLNTMENFFYNIKMNNLPKYSSRIFPISSTHSELRFVVPANCAYDVCKNIIHEYNEIFNKVSHSFPMSIGMIFFYKKFPLYLALDASKRILPTIKSEEDVFILRNIEETDKYYSVNLIPEIYQKDSYEGFINWKIKKTLSNNTEIDKIYTKFNLFNFSEPESIEELKVKSDKNAKISVYDGKFSFIFLDSPARRLDITSKDIKKPVFPLRKVFYLSEWERFERVLKLIEKITLSQLMNIEATLIEKIMSWENKWNYNDSTSRHISEMLLFSPNAFGKKNREKYALLDEGSNHNPPNINSDKDLLIRSCFDGILLNAIDFYAHIEALNKN